MIEDLKNEIGIMKMISHPNVVELIEVLASKTKIYIVLELIEGGELWEQISSIFSNYIEYLNRNQSLNWWRKNEKIL